MATILEALKRVDFFRGIECPYEFLVALYHISLSFEDFIIDQKQHAKPSKISAFIVNMDLDSGDDSFDIDEALTKLESMISNERRGAYFLFQMLTQMDAHIAGRWNNQFRKNSATTITSRVLGRLKNPHYYHPIRVKIENEEFSYVILPRIEPYYAQFITNKLSRNVVYFSKTLAEHCLKHHQLLRDGRVQNKKVAFPVNGMNHDKHSSFMDSFSSILERSIKKLVIGLSPCDSGFVPEPVSHEKVNAQSVPFHYSRIKEPSQAKIKLRFEGILKEAQERSVDILIFPELTVDHDALTSIIEFLQLNNEPDQLKLVVAGSFHYARDEGGYVNSATMLDWKGSVIWRHHKLKEYVLKSAEIEKAANPNALRGLFGAQPLDDLKEFIHTDHPMTFVDTPIGRMATLICLDYLLPVVEDLVGHVGCHYLWVPLMTTSIGAFETHAKDVYGAKYHILSACSASVSCTQLIRGRRKSYSFLYAPSTKFISKSKNLRNNSNVIRVNHPPLVIYKLDSTL